MSFTEYGETEKVCFSFSLRRRRAERGSRNFRTNVRLMRLLWEKVSREMQQSAYAHRGHIMTWDCVVLHVKTSKKSLPIFSRGFHFQKFPMKKKALVQSKAGTSTLLQDCISDHALAGRCRFDPWLVSTRQP
jgi:hypothetical protein